MVSGPVSPAWAATTMSAHVVVADAARFDHRDAGRVDEDVAGDVGALELHQSYRVACLALVRLFSLPRPGLLRRVAGDHRSLDW